MNLNNFMLFFREISFSSISLRDDARKDRSLAKNAFLIWLWMLTGMFGDLFRVPMRVPNAPQIDNWVTFLKKSEGKLQNLPNRVRNKSMVLGRR